MVPETAPVFQMENETQLLMRHNVPRISNTASQQNVSQQTIQLMAKAKRKNNKVLITTNACLISYSSGVSKSLGPLQNW